MDKELQAIVLSKKTGREARTVYVEGNFPIHTAFTQSLLVGSDPAVLCWQGRTIKIFCANGEAEYRIDRFEEEFGEMVFLADLVEATYDGQS